MGYRRLINIGNIKPNHFPQPSRRSMIICLTRSFLRSPYEPQWVTMRPIHYCCNVSMKHWSISRYLLSTGVATLDAHGWLSFWSTSRLRLYEARPSDSQDIRCLSVAAIQCSESVAFRTLRPPHTDNTVHLFCSIFWSNCSFRWR